MLLLSHFSRVRLSATSEAAAHQAPPSLGFSRQEPVWGWYTFLCRLLWALNKPLQVGSCLNMWIWRDPLEFGLWLHSSKPPGFQHIMSSPWASVFSSVKWDWYWESSVRQGLIWARHRAWPESYSRNNKCRYCFCCGCFVNASKMPGKKQMPSWWELCFCFILF